MLSDEKAKFKQLVIGLFMAFNKKPESGVIDVWLNVFKKYTIDDIRQAFSDYVENEKFPPVPSEVLKYISGAPKKITAADAWEWVPRGEYESKWVTDRMMAALGTAEESISQGDMVGAKIAFTESYNARIPDHEFKYSGGYNVPHEEKLRVKVESYKLLKAKQWVSLEQQATIELKLTNQMNEAKRISSDLEGSLSSQALTKQGQDTKNQSETHVTGNGLPPINRELNKKRVKELRSTLSTITSSNQSDTGKD